MFRTYCHLSIGKLISTRNKIGKFMQNNKVPQTTGISNCLTLIAQKIVQTSYFQHHFLFDQNLICPRPRSKWPHNSWPLLTIHIYTCRPRKHTHTLIYIYTYTYKHTHIHTHIHSHIHTYDVRGGWSEWPFSRQESAGLGNIMSLLQAAVPCILPYKTRNYNASQMSPLSLLYSSSVIMLPPCNFFFISNYDAHCNSG